MNQLRPDKLSDILGQKQIVEVLNISIKSAKSRNDCLAHTLFYGPPGTGKTTLANAIANEMGCSLQIANGANLRSIKNLLPYVMRVEDHSILFIDEIHRMTSIVEEFLYPVMEDFKVDMSMSGKEIFGETISIDIPRFTLMGATTEYGSLSKPLIDRFQHKHTLKLYNKVELQEIVNINSKKLNLKMSDKASVFVTKVSRGTPRIANAALEWLRDYRIAQGSETLSESDVETAMGMRGIDSDGMTEMDRKYLKTLKTSGQPLGIETLSCMTGIDRQTIEGIIEPWLLQNSKIIKTSKGRMCV
jgi:Holliday junction DNA helicase RuvB